MNKLLTILSSLGLLSNSVLTNSNILDTKIKSISVMELLPNVDHEIQAVKGEVSYIETVPVVSLRDISALGETVSSFARDYPTLYITLTSYDPSSEDKYNYAEAATGPGGSLDWTDKSYPFSKPHNWSDYFNQSHMLIVATKSWTNFIGTIRDYTYVGFWWSYDSIKQELNFNWYLYLDMNNRVENGHAKIEQKGAMVNFLP